MPVIIPRELPAYEILSLEKLNVMDLTELDKDLNIKKIAILNLMPTKVETETQLLRVLANSDFNIEVTLLTTSSYEAKNTCAKHILKFYKTFNEIKNEKFDGMIITGAPIELLQFEEVDYWAELKEIMDFANQNIKSTLYICWAAQAGLYHNYGIKKYINDNNKKTFGVFSHINNKNSKLVTGFDDEFFAPHSRYTYVKKDDIEVESELQIISESKEAGIYIVQSTDLKKIFVTGHSEYDPLTLFNEYKRDVEKNLDINIPNNYFEDNNPNNSPVVRWRSHANLLFSNWIKILA